jgi:serine/threonine protein kinase
MNSLSECSDDGEPAGAEGASMKSDPCPSGDHLIAFVLGKLPEEQAIPLAEHTSECPKCQAQLRNSDTLSDDLIDQLRNAPTPDPLDGEPELAQLMAQIETASGLPGGHSHPDESKGGLDESADVSREAKEVLAPPQQSDEIGRLGAYRVLKILGAGGMGIVFQAEDPQLRRQVALKVMKPSLANQAISRQRFLREAQATAQVRNDHVVTVYQVGEEGDAPYLAMEFLEGQTLESYLKRSGSGKALPIGEIVRIGLEIAEGLAAAHACGLIHRDIKPANIWLEKNRNRVKIVDFGLARAIVEDNRLTVTGSVLGTPAYMAPEQANGQPTDARCDLFSLGCVLYLLCTGRTAFRGETTIDTMLAVVNEHPKPIGELNPRIPQPLIDLVNSLLAKKSAERPESARVVVEVLQGIKRHLENSSVADPTLSLPVSGAKLAAKRGPAPSSSRPLVGVLFGLVIFAGGVALFVWSKQGEQARPTGTEVAQSAVPTGPTPSTPTASTEKGLLPGDEFNKMVAKLRGTQQIRAVSDRLKQLNPGFPGIGPNKEGFFYTKQHPDGSFGIWKVVFPTDTVTDLSPLAALTELGQVVVAGSKPGQSKLRDLRPLKELKLTLLDISNTEVADLTPLQPMASSLTWLYIRNTRIDDLSALKVMTELKELECDPPTRQSNVVVLRVLPNLKKINGQVRGEYLNSLKLPPASK